jgi:hypothetical protein
MTDSTIDSIRNSQRTFDRIGKPLTLLTAVGLWCWGIWTIALLAVLAL